VWYTIPMDRAHSVKSFERPGTMAAAILAVALVAGVCAQEKPRISVRSYIVTLFATVHDPDGRVVKNLSQDDFVLLEDGVPQKIEFFSQESGLPLAIGLLVDTSRSQIGVLDQERRASYKFLDQVLRQGKDQAFVVRFDTQVETLQPPTSSRDDLEQALARLKIPERHATLVFSAVKDASKDWMNDFMGRKAFILLSDGVAFKEPTRITTAIEYAQRADTIIYPIRFADPVPLSRPVIGPILAFASKQGKKALQRMADETGGAYYEVTESRSIEQIYAEIEDALRSQYSIGYTPARAESDGKYHKIKLTAKDRRLSVNSRAGYYAR
jgi:VWFA-related protein